MDYTNSTSGEGGIFGKMFHFPKTEEIQFPNYFNELWPLFLGLVLTEYVGLAMKGKRPRLAESLNSLGHGIISETTKIITLGIEVSLYVSIHQKYRLVELPWDSWLTWVLAFLGVDLAYYFAHRATHEINFLWAQHQVHHSSEDFNIAVSVRHPLSHSWINSFFYLPLAFVVPTPHCLAHQQFNIIYQAWIHTSIIGSLGPLEYILNTPTHHKVHHGCNLYVLDKNFGGFLIIWDRIFGTFQEMKPEEELVFGIVFQHQSFNPFWQMVHKFPGLWERVKSQNSWGDSFRVLFYGPSWVEGVGAPRLGRDEDKVDVKPRKKFEVELPIWLQAYLILHFLALAGIFYEFATKKGNLDQLSLGLTLAYFIFTLTTIGLLSEGNPWGPSLELTRCLFCIFFGPPSLGTIPTALFLPSVFLWLYFGSKSLFHGEPQSPMQKED